MASPLTDFADLVRKVFRFLRYAGVVFLVVTLVMIAREVHGLYAMARDVHPFLGYAMLGVTALLAWRLLGVPAWRYLRTPAVVRPPVLPEKAEDTTAADVARRVAYLDRYLASLGRNPNLRESAADVPAAAGRLAGLRPKLDDADPAAARTALGRFEADVVAPLLAPLDREADRLIRAEALSVGTATAISPNGALDAAIVLWRNANLVSRIANLYYARPGVRGSFLVLRDVSGAALLAGHLEAVSDLAGGFVRGLLGLVPGALTDLLLDGTVNALVTLRVGYLAKARCRSLAAWSEPAKRRILGEVRDATAAAARGVFAEIAKAVTKGAAGLPGRMAGKVRDGIANVLRSFRGEEEPEPA